VIEEMLEYLEQRNLSQSWLAQQMRVSRAHISRILNAPPNMTLLTIAKIAVALGVRPDVCLNAESWRLTSVVPAAVDFMALGPSGDAYFFEVKRPLGAVRRDRPSAAESVPLLETQKVPSAV
jgi:transcriptional regulator with XRE-family HTH domain